MVCSTKLSFLGQSCSRCRVQLYILAYCFVGKMAFLLGELIWRQSSLTKVFLTHVKHFQEEINFVHARNALIREASDVQFMNSVNNQVVSTRCTSSTPRPRLQQQFVAFFWILGNVHGICWTWYQWLHGSHLWPQLYEWTGHLFPTKLARLDMNVMRKCHWLMDILR